jgi:hypothetical protein
MGWFSRKQSLPASIRRISYRPRPGASWYYWTYVLFESRGQLNSNSVNARQNVSSIIMLRGIPVI